MKEVLIDRSSWHYKVAVRLGGLHFSLTNSWNEPISSCDYWSRVMKGCISFLLLFGLAAVAAIAVQDFVMWLGFSLFVSFVEPNPMAHLVIAFIGAASLLLIIFAIFKLFELGQTATDKIEVVKSFKDSVVHKLCVPIRLKE
jgi:hypothetical protein